MEEMTKQHYKGMDTSIPLIVAPLALPVAIIYKWTLPRANNITFLS